MELGVIELLVALASLCFVTYKYVTWTFDYWEKRGVPGPKPTFPFGNFTDLILRRKAFLFKMQEFYNTYKNEPFFGYFGGRIPILVVKDPDLIKDILIKDFSVFSGRGVVINEKVDPLSAHLVNIDGNRWKVLRNKLTPVFTTGKIKQMFNLMSECADNFEHYLKDVVKKQDQIECRECAAKYTTDVIGSCAFGIDTQALSDEFSVFRQVGRKLFEPSPIAQMKRFMREIFPRLFRLLGIRMIAPRITKFFIDTMKQTIDLRKKENIRRNDFVDVLMNIPKDNIADGFEWTNDLLTAQAFVFFAAGFETSSTTISFGLWELARAPEVQDKLRQEIIETYKKNDGKITYESVSEMKYLDMVIKEVLRKNSPVSMLKRMSSQEYVIGGTNVKLPKNQIIHIPTNALHYDPQYYPKPDVFDPERFSDEAKKTRHPMVFLPFGDGPKNCIGMRFAYYQVKLALIKVIKNFRVIPTTRPDETYAVDKNAALLTPIGGIVLKFEPLAAL